MAPEIFEDKDYTLKADVFSYGVKFCLCAFVYQEQ